MFKAKLSRSFGVFSLLGLAILMPHGANAQIGSALGNNPLLHQSDNYAGVDDARARGDKEGGQRIVKDVQKGMQDADPKVRVASLEKLRFLQEPEVNDLLLGGLADTDVRVKIKAIDLLGARQVTDAVSMMSQYLFLRSTEDVMKIHLVAALGRIGDARGALPVMQYLQQTTDDRSRGTAVFALGEIGDSRATDILSKTATDDKSPMVRRLSQEALEKIDGEVPIQRVAKTAVEGNKSNQPTDQKLAKLREEDEESRQQR
jgi:HEAT repeat protein